MGVTLQSFEINKVYHGDHFEIMKNIPDNFIDMVLCDLPYNITAAKWDNKINLDLLWENYNRICKKNAGIILTSVQPFTSILVMSNLKMYRHEWIWEKEQGTGQLNAKISPLRNHENILVFSKEKVNYYPVKSVGKPYNKIKNINIDNKNNNLYNGGITLEGYDKENVTDRYPKTVIKFNRELKNRFHPTQKPVKLLEFLINNYSKENDIILDNTAGSSSTAIACLKTNRNYIMIEKEQNYYDISLERINNFKKEINKNINLF